MTNERWLRWAIARHFRRKGFRVNMKPVKVGNAAIDGEVTGALWKMALEIKSGHDDVIRRIRATDDSAGTRIQFSCPSSIAKTREEPEPHSIQQAQHSSTGGRFESSCQPSFSIIDEMRRVRLIQVGTAASPIRKLRVNAFSTRDNSW